MKVTGFTIIRNAIKYDYPVVEAITSILPLCDEFVVAVGNSEDDTLNLIRNINSPKIRIIETVWNDSLREGGRVLADETNKAYDAISADTDWCFYIQSDEVIHEKYHGAIRSAMQKYKDDPQVEGLLFNYVHFYGSYSYVGNSRRWYRREIRIVRKNNSIRSYKDAQGFRKTDNSKLHVKAIDAAVFHYGWVKPPKAQQAKQENFHKMWHDDEWMKKNVAVAEEFDYSNIDSLEAFKDTHPAVMQARVDRMNWQFSFDKSQIRLSAKDKLLLFIEKQTGWKVGEYRNYILLK
ncbi:MAG: glycosyltransferase family 2 protein [Bacteroidetes bacterium]|nr:glycosyltransferase family 2 protein [Bacteroidota bacterium]